MNKKVLSSKEVKHFINNINEHDSMIDLLTEDIEKIEKNLDNVKSENELQFWLRIAVRTLIDSINTMIYTEKETALKIIKIRGDEKKLFSKQKKKDIRKFFKELAIAFHSDFEIKEDDKHLEKYIDAHKIRHRVTHPRNLKDLSVSVDEHNKIINVFEWFSNCLYKLMCQSKYTKRRQQKNPVQP